ncbi:DUF4236 domain-containing protein [Acinetobacter pollinis]|uniref:DUF4236 domain-containing protein n=1 Tax=Acinetobacter pollinis TaxID=2605270 RepID=UPI0018C25584|nr:DUF4236 domain-containing protein [Acinetobacter pollinis]MBF7694148.1 DUF4236 domain-containing protein [Acinetobacter pollinis]MBF7701740.1 DUF4236 domain-containing protein [Acinetobacter pollinis]
MGLRFRKSIKFAPGVRLNIGKNGISSVSIGKNRAKVNVSKKGTRATVGLPGTGFSYSAYTPRKKSHQSAQHEDLVHKEPSQELSGKEIFGLIILGIIVVSFIIILFFLL